MTPFFTSSIALFTPHTSRAPTPATRTTAVTAQPMATFFLLLMVAANSLGSDRSMSAPPSPTPGALPPNSRPADGGRVRRGDGRRRSSRFPTGATPLRRPRPYGSIPGEAEAAVRGGPAVHHAAHQPGPLLQPRQAPGRR